MLFAARRIGVVSLLVLVGCSASQPAPVQAVPRGGTLRLVEWAGSNATGYNPHPALVPDATTLDPVLTVDPGAYELFRCCVGRSLLSYTGQPTDEGGSVLRPDLAKALPEVSADGLTWIFHLRPGIHYAPPLQRTEIVAADFVRAFEREVRLYPAPLGPFYSVIRGFDEFAAGKTSSVQGLETPDLHTLVVRLVQADGDFGYRLNIGGFLIPLPALPDDPVAPYGVATGHDKGYGPFSVSSGPYMVEGSEKLDFTVPPERQQPVSGLVPGRSLTLVRNPSWNPAIDRLRPAYADRIEISFTGTPDDAAASLDRGVADLVLPGNVGGALAGEAPLDQVRAYQSDRRRGRVEVRPLDAIEYLSMNLAVPPFDDLHVRRAVAYAIDRQALLGAYGGPLKGSLIGHIALDSMEDNALLTFDPYRTKDPASRIVAAHAEMARSRYDADHDGICDVAACRHIAAISRVNRPPATTDVITQGLAAIGIMIETRPLGSDDFFNQINEPTSRSPIAFLWTPGTKDYPNAGDWFPSMFAASAAGAGPMGTTDNFSLVGATADQLRKWGYTVTSVPNVDDRIAQCFPLIGAAQTRCWTALDVYLMENVVPVLPLVSINQVQIIPSRVLSYSYDQSAAAPALDRIAVKR